MDSRYPITAPKLQDEAKELLPFWMDVGIDDAGKWGFQTCVCLHGVTKALEMFAYESKIPVSVLTAHYYIRNPDGRFCKDLE